MGYFVLSLNHSHAYRFWVKGLLCTYIGTHQRDVPMNGARNTNCTSISFVYSFSKSCIFNNWDNRGWAGLVRQLFYADFLCFRLWCRLSERTVWLKVSCVRPLVQR